MDTVNLPQQHDEEKEISEEPDDNEDDVEDDHGDQEPGVRAEQLPEVRLGQVHSLITVQVGKELRDISDIMTRDSAN